MQDARWLFFDLGNVLISEEMATECRIQELVNSLERYASEEVRASEEFAPRLITGAIEKLIDDLGCRQLIEAEARYQKELEVPYEGAEANSMDVVVPLPDWGYRKSVRRHSGTVDGMGIDAVYLDLSFLGRRGP